MAGTLGIDHLDVLEVLSLLVAEIHVALAELDRVGAGAKVVMLAHRLDVEVEDVVGATAGRRIARDE